MASSPVPADIYVVTAEVLSLSVEVRNKDSAMRALKSMGTDARASEHRLVVDLNTDCKNLVLLSDNFDPEGTAGAIIMSNIIHLVGKERFDVRLACDYPTVELEGLRQRISTSGNCAVLFITSILICPRCLCLLCLAIELKTWLFLCYFPTSSSRIQITLTLRLSVL